MFRSLGRPRRRWVDNIRMDLQDVGCGYMDWIGLAQDTDRWRTLVSAVMNLRVPWNAGNFLTSCKPVSFSRRTLHHGVSKCNVLDASRITVFLTLYVPLRKVLLSNIITSIISNRKELGHLLTFSSNVLAVAASVYCPRFACLKIPPEKQSRVPNCTQCINWQGK